jgi:hypothetical protein
MKQASFKIDEVEKIKTTSNIKTNNKLTNDENKKTITSNKPIKRVENIYYFR